MPPVLFLLLAGLTLFVLWKACQPRWSVRIKAEPDAKPSMQGVPQNRIWQIEEFFERDVRLPERVTVYALREPSGRWRIAFRGKIDGGCKQRIRNFLHQTL